MRVEMDPMENRIGDRVLRKIKRWLGIESPSLAFANVVGGTATEGEKRLFAKMAKDHAEMVAGFSEDERKMIDDAVTPTKGNG